MRVGFRGVQREFRADTRGLPVGETEEEVQETAYGKNRIGVIVGNRGR